MKRKPGETIQELDRRIQHDAVMCDFQFIMDPLDEALRTRLICSVDNETVLKVLLELKDDELIFAKKKTMAQETEQAAKVRFMGKHLGKFTRWDSQRTSPIHLELLQIRPRTQLR